MTEFMQLSENTSVMNDDDSELGVYPYLSHAQLRAEPCRVPCWAKIGPPPVFTNAHIIIARPQLGAITVIDI
jgi:hypothetical protein